MISKYRPSARIYAYKSASMDVSSVETIVIVKLCQIFSINFQRKSYHNLIKHNTINGTAHTHTHTHKHTSKITTLRSIDNKQKET